MLSYDLYPNFYAECHMLYYKEFISLLVTQDNTKLHISSCILCSGLKKQKKKRKKSIREKQVLFVMLVRSDEIFSLLPQFLKSEYSQTDLAETSSAHSLIKS